ncbi:hypothetical protein [Mucilaginibacter dorajii]|uniref:Uncharacterized protein n=1 Tax=Mucilaginibacter dorajii TaxID=692994 RepID=A0ABP7R059_9SPHI|nr:hypothetical protein [Mucilaginibacter dorajii]MCS3732252.1 hypothetical protein [Mucilaginibacter dorajii]
MLKIESDDFDNPIHIDEVNKKVTAVISFSYRFGKVIAGQRQHEANGAEDERNGVRQ